MTRHHFDDPRWWSFTRNSGLRREDFAPRRWWQQWDSDDWGDVIAVVVAICIGIWLYMGGGRP